MMTDIGEEAAIAEVQPTVAFGESETSVDFSDATKKLTNGLLSIYQQPFEQVSKELNDLTTKQESCIKQMLLENKKLCEVVEDIEISDLFFTIDIYQKKLVNIKREIMNIHERTAKLKKRALKLQQNKQKEAHLKETNEQGIRKSSTNQ